MDDESMDDESLSSVDQFLRDNGFSISDSALGLASFSGDDVLDDDLLSDAEERPPPTRSRSDESPRFVLLEDEDLLLSRDPEGDRDHEREEDAKSRDSLDRSMLFGGSDGQQTLELPQGTGTDMESATLVSAASSVHSSSVSSGRVLDDELTDALGVPRSATSSRGKKSVASESHSQELRTSGALFMEEGHLSAASGRELSDADEKSRSSQYRSGSDDHSSFHEEKKEENDSVEEIAIESGQRDAVEIDEGAWNGLNDLLRRNGLPAVRFRHVGSETLPDRESLFNVIHDFSVQLERKNETIQDLVLASKRNSRVRSKREGELQTIEKKNEDTRNALEKAKAEIQRLKALQKKENESAEFLSKKLKNSCLRLQQQLKVSEHRVKAKEVIVEKMQAKLQQQVDKENMNKMRDRRAFRNLQDRDPRRANPRDIQALEAIGVYEAQREQM
ncbi:Hypothetical protein PHPALM_6591, partial [Phytophthora palmivora]